MTIADPTKAAVIALALSAASCGLEGKRFSVCSQEGAICEVFDTEAPDADVSGSDHASRDTAASDGTQGSADTGSGSGDSVHDTDTTSGGTASEGDTDGEESDESDESDGSTGGELLEPPAGFPAPQSFGDSVLETDLIGTWVLPTSGPTLAYSMALEITDQGRIRWREYDEGCATTQSGAGWVWVEGSQLVFLFGNWNGPAPWPVQAKYGWDAEAPFMIRAGYAPALGHIGLTLPPPIREAEPWAGQGYTRTVGGTTAQDIWIAETELWAIAPGAQQSDIVVRDRSTLDFLSQPGAAVSTANRWWFSGGQADAEPAASWLSTYVDDGVGNVAVAGTPHVYLGGRLANFSPGNNFLLGGEVFCE
ncbi:MAG: hypothetical protein JKY37_04805 [Nannocystaceae bacterium]|nr:hypothetical protein [Nannocystaceae bacterium]